MKNPISFTVTVGGKDYTDHTPFPIKWSGVLNEQLDEAKISLKYCLTKLFAPLTPVKIVAKSRLKTVEKNYVIATDCAQELPIKSGRWNHELSLIEESKLLEGFIVDALTFTNDLGRNYTSNAKPVLPEVKTNMNEGFPVATISTYISPLKSETQFTFLNCRTVFGDSGTLPEYTMQIYKNGAPIHTVIGAPARDDVPCFTTLESALYEAYYKKTVNPGAGPRWTSASYLFSSIPNQDPLPRWNITSVINRVLNLAETHLNGVEPRFKLNTLQAEEFSKIEAPEFAFTKSTLKEILDQIGGFIHGIPRLQGDTIYYDMLGGTKLAKLSGRDEFMITNLTSQNIENYCSKLDSSVDNLVNILDRAQGVITEPYSNGYKTVRTETVYSRIEEGNMCISTSFPIQDISMLKCGIVSERDGAQIYGGDITPYIFEAADYSRLSSFDTKYPTSKAYALYFTQGEKNIYGLSFKVKDATGGVFKKYAIANILRETCGVDISSWSEATDYPTLAFQIAYIPIFNARVQASKQNITDFKYPRTLAYNQGANLVETRYYGENMKGVIARMGNAEQIRTYILEGFNLVPEIGEIFEEDYYATSVDVEVMPTEVKCTVGLSKDFNRLSEYIGINSHKRYYEVSEKQAYKRDISYVDYCVIGDEVPFDDKTWLASYTTLQFIDSFIKGGGTNLITMAQIKSYVGDSYNPNTPIATVLLPVISTAFGNSIVFTFGFEDNYSAGLQSVESTNGEVRGNFTQSVEYGDYYGRIDYLAIDLLESGIGFSNKKGQTLLGNAFPKVVHNAPNAILSTPWNKPLTVKKNGAEIIALNYQIEFVSNKNNYIIGSAIARNCSFVRGGGQESGHGAKLVILPKRLSKFADVVDIVGATELIDYNINPQKITTTSQTIKFANEIANANGLSWAIIEGKSHELLIGCNMNIVMGDTLAMPNMTFRHDIYK